MTHAGSNEAKKSKKKKIFDVIFNRLPYNNNILFKLFYYDAKGIISMILY